VAAVIDFVGSAGSATFAVETLRPGARLVGVGLIRKRPLAGAQAALDD